MKIIDFRLRPPLRGFLSTLMYTNAARRDGMTASHGMEPAPSAQAQSIELLLKEMDAAGVARGVVTGRNSAERLGSVSNEDVAAIVKDYPDRFIGVPSINPRDRREAVRQIETAAESGMVGVNIEPGAFSPPLLADDRTLYPIYAYCEDNEVPVIIMAGGNAGPDLSYTSPIHIDRVAMDFPKMRIAVSHGGWPWVTEILHIAYRRPNLYVSPDQYFCNMPGMQDYFLAANGFLSERFIYGSSYPFLPVEGCAEWFRKQAFRLEVLERLMYGNAARFLNLTL
jgi:predicted TIM-barrel fold metal-dependent hydrolase